MIKSNSLAQKPSQNSYQLDHLFGKNTDLSDVVLAKVKPAAQFQFSLPAPALRCPTASDRQRDVDEDGVSVWFHLHHGHISRPRHIGHININPQRRPSDFYRHSPAPF